MMIMGHPTLNQNVREASESLALAGLLGEFHTTINTSKLSKIMLGRARDSLARRALPSSVDNITRAHPFNEIARLLSRSAQLDQTLGKRFSIDNSFSAIDSIISSRIQDDTSAVYAYEDGAFKSFSRALEVGVPRIYDLPIGYWKTGREILAEESDLNPSWASTIQGLTDSTRKLQQKDAELDKASLVIVASQFTLQTLQSYPGQLPPVTVIPYGAKPPPEQLSFSNRRKLRALYVGSLTQRKGISYMFDAVNMLGDDVELTVVGRHTGQSLALNSALDSVKWHKSLSHNSVLEIMRSHDVLIFPSLFEGFGLVLTEALSQGMPIITTANTAGPDLITDGIEGWIVPIRSSSAIADCLTKLVEDVDLRNQMKINAAEAALRHSWVNYQNHLVGAVRKIIQ